MATESKPSDLSEQAMALAEQLGRIAGTVEGTAEAWLRNPGLADQLARVRDGAADMLKSLTKGKTTGKKKKAVGRAARKADPARAPGKKRRKPAPSLVGVKKSDERIPKMRSAAAARQRRKSYA